MPLTAPTKRQRLNQQPQQQPNQQHRQLQQGQQLQLRQQQQQMQQPLLAAAPPTVMYGGGQHNGFMSFPTQPMTQHQQHMPFGATTPQPHLAQLQQQPQQFQPPLPQQVDAAPEESEEDHDGIGK